MLTRVESEAGLRCTRLDPLFGYGSDKDKEDNGGQTSNRLAVKKGWCHVAHILVTVSAYITARRGGEESTALDCALTGSFVAVVELLSELVADVNAAWPRGELALHRAVPAILMASVGALIGTGVIMDVQDAGRVTTATRAARKGACRSLKTRSHLGSYALF